MEQELDNLRGAIDWLSASREGQLVQRLAGALSEFWCGKEHVPEGRRHLETSLELDSNPSPARAKALVGAAHMARDCGDAAAASERAQDALDLYRTYTDEWGVAFSLLWLGQALVDQGELAQAKNPDFQESARRFSELGHEHNVLAANRLSAWMFNDLGDRRSARALHVENLERARAVGNKRIEATTLGALASYAVDEGQTEEAASLASASLRLYLGLGSRRGTLTELSRCAGALVLSGKAQIAARLLSCSETLHEEMGLGVLPYLAAENDVTLALIRRQLGEAATAEAWKQGKKLALDEAAELALRELAPDG